MNKRLIFRAILCLFTTLYSFVPHSASAQCAAPARPLDVRAANWGLGNGNHRFQSKSTINSGNAASLQLRWVFALGDGEDTSPHSLPVVTADTIYIVSQHGILHALDRNTGCERWRFRSDQDIRTAVGIYSLKNKHNDKQRRVLVFGGIDAWLYAVDAYSGELIWRRQVDDQRFVMITGTPTYVDGRLIVGLSSYEAVVAALPFYSCCRFRGAVLALDAHSGEEIWRRRLIAKRPKPLSDNGLWTTSWGPSGIPVWSRPAVDIERRRVFVGTGENYSGTQSTAHSDAILALDLDSGRILWSHQFLADDVWNVSCDLPVLGLNCRRAKAGQDMDFGAAPVSAHISRLGRVVFGGQKSGHVYAMNADDGSLIWQQKPGRGGKLGGVHWGMAYDPLEKTLYVPVNDQGGNFLVNPEGDGTPGIYALNAKTGELRWKYDDGRACPPNDCAHGFSAAITASSDVVAAAMLDGQVVLLDSKTGVLLWQFDTNKEWPAVNGEAIGGETALGGSIDVHGPLLVDDMLIVQSGYATMGNDGGNALMVFGLPVQAVAPVDAVDKSVTKPEPVAQPLPAQDVSEQQIPEQRPAEPGPTELPPVQPAASTQQPFQQPVLQQPALQQAPATPPVAAPLPQADTPAQPAESPAPAGPVPEPALAPDAKPQ